MVTTCEPCGGSHACTGAPTATLPGHAALLEWAKQANLDGVPKAALARRLQRTQGLPFHTKALMHSIAKATTEMDGVDKDDVANYIDSLTTAGAVVCWFSLGASELGQAQGHKRRKIRTSGHSKGLSARGGTDSTNPTVRAQLYVVCIGGVNYALSDNWMELTGPSTTGVRDVPWQPAHVHAIPARRAGDFSGSGVPEPVGVLRTHWVPRTQEPMFFFWF